jgi:hypothetical protein
VGHKSTEGALGELKSTGGAAQGELKPTEGVARGELKPTGKTIRGEIKSTAGVAGCKFNSKEKEGKTRETGQIKGVGKAKNSK